VENSRRDSSASGVEPAYSRGCSGFDGGLKNYYFARNDMHVTQSLKINAKTKIVKFPTRTSYRMALKAA